MSLLSSLENEGYSETSQGVGVAPVFKGCNVTGYKVIGVDDVIDNIKFSAVLRGGLYAVPYYKLYVKEPDDKTIAKIALIDLVNKHGISEVAKKFKVNYTTIMRNYKKQGSKISPKLKQALLKTEHVIKTINITRVVLQACYNEYLINKWAKKEANKKA